MTDEEIIGTRLKVLEKDLASINNRLHHAFNQGFELGRKSATPKEKTGRWIKHNTPNNTYYYDCSLCGCVAPCTETADSYLWKLSNFCPDCGAKMEVEK